MEDGARLLTYAALAEQVEQLAGWLAAKGVAPGSLVALDMGRSTDLVIALLAVWRAGGAYLPLDPQWPAARRAG